MEIKIKMQGMEQATKSLKDLGDALKRFSEENRERYIKELCTSCTKEEMAGVVVDLEKQLNEMKKIANRCGDRCSELESELECSRECTKTLRRMLGLRSAKENIELANKLYELNFEVPDDEEPLPFSSDEYEEDRIDKLEKRITEIEKTLDEQRKAELKSLKTETDFLKSRMAQSGFLAEILGY